MKKMKFKISDQPTIAVTTVLAATTIQPTIALLHGCDFNFAEKIHLHQKIIILYN